MNQYTKNAQSVESQISTLVQKLKKMREMRRVALSRNDTTWLIAIRDYSSTLRRDIFCLRNQLLDY